MDNVQNFIMIIKYFNSGHFDHMYKMSVLGSVSIQGIPFTYMLATPSEYRLLVNPCKGENNFETTGPAIHEHGMYGSIRLRQQWS